MLFVALQIAINIVVVDPDTLIVVVLLLIVLVVHCKSRSFPWHITVLYYNMTGFCLSTLCCQACASLQR